MDAPGSGPLDAGYAEMAADAQREEAREWSEGVLLAPDDDGGAIEGGGITP